MLEINEAFLQTTGYASEELLGKTVEEIGFLDKDASAALFARLEKGCRCFKYRRQGAQEGRRTHRL
nr:hypothetical protein GCM10020185_68110 [Pseudomonas brassicacearum subsp. brassicacearum]